jgi:hypothetical protein
MLGAEGRVMCEVARISAVAEKERGKRTSQIVEQFIVEKTYMASYVKTRKSQHLLHYSWAGRFGPPLSTMGL